MNDNLAPHLKFFNFKEEPFNLTPDPRFFFLSCQHEDVIESIQYGINNRKGFMAVIGDIGTGKTTTCRTLISRLDKKIDTSVIFNPILSVLELLQAINEDFGNKQAIFQNTVKGQIDALNSFLLKRLKWEKNAMVLIDEAQNLSTEALEMMRLLSNLETDNQKLLQIIFVGQNELGEKLKSPELRQLNQRIIIRCRLNPLDYTETCQYVIHRIQVAAYSGYPRVRFDEKALRAIFEYTKGTPRLINMVSERVLLEAFASAERQVSKEMVDSAAKELEGPLSLDILAAESAKKPWHFWKWFS